MTVKPAPAIALGVIAGTVGGLFGVGGGVIVVPGLVLLLGFDQRRASGTSVATIVVSATAALIPFARDSAVSWGPALLVTIGATVGAALGARLLHRIPAAVLTRAFAVLMLIAAVRLAVA